MYTESIDIGKAARDFRRKRSFTKEQMAEELGISVSYVEKIEAGRRPGMETYQRLLAFLGADMVIHKEAETVQKKCAGKIQEILMGSTEAQAVFMAGMVEAMAQNLAQVMM